MKKLLIAALAALSIASVAPAASAAVPADSGDRALIKSILTVIWNDDLTYEDRENICWGWNAGFRTPIYSNLVPTIRESGFSRYDAQLALKQFFNKVCQ